MKHAEIELPRKLVQDILKQAQLSPDSEICGLIGANQIGKPECCYPIKNCAENPSDRYLLDSSQQIAAMKTIRQQNQNLFAIYHSHPNSPALPSKIDIEEATYKEAYQLIISLQTKGVLEIRAFSINANTVQEIPISLIEA